jgi:xanthine dehydrogenase YagR molybdenum-binding subunit
MPKLVKTKVEVEGRTTEEFAWVSTPKTTVWDVEEELKIVGKPIARVDGVERVTGMAKYTTDIQLPRMVHAKYLRSPHPHARILSIDTSQAESMTGVRGILHSKNIASNRFAKHRDLFNDPVRFVGDEVAVIFADSEELAAEALKKIRVEYEILPYVLDPEAALGEGAPQVTPNGNLLDGKPSTYTRGDADKAFAEADVIVSGVFSTAPQIHSALETHSTVAEWDGKTMTIWESSQAVDELRERVAKQLNLDAARVRVIAEYIGGAFGAKFGAGKHTILAAVMAHKLHRPVRFVLDRHGEQLAAGQRAATKQILKLGAKRDGTLTAIELTGYNNLGGYATWSPFLEGPARELYACENIRTTNYGVFTHTPPFAAFRAPGFVEAIFALESLLDDLAAKLNMDPLELRMKNYSSVYPETGKSYTSNGLLDAYQIGARAIDWEAKKKKKATNGTVRRGVGMGSQIWYGAGAPPSYAVIRINSDASATILTASQDLGTGTKTILCQIAAEELGLPLECFEVEIADTQSGPYAGSSGGSMTAASVGPAVREAAADACEQLTQLVATYLKKRIKDVRIENGMVKAKGKEQSVASILKELDNINILGHGSRNPNPSDYEIRTFGAQFAEVAVDTETGEVRVERIVASHDSGRILNPLTVSSQIEGGVLQGMGFGLTEGRIVDASGFSLNANLEGYHVPTIADAPRIETHMVDRADTLANNLGVKGVGEPPIIPTAAAIANAIYDAIGVRFYDTPITRDKVLNALEKIEQETLKMEQRECL